MYYGVIFLLLSLIAVFCFYCPTTRYYKILFLLAFMLLFLTSGLRYETAVDWVNYERFFINVDNILYISDYGFSEFLYKYPSEPLFTLLNSAVKVFTDNVQVLFFIISLISTTLVFRSIFHFTEKRYFFFSVLLYYVLVFFILDMSGIRQGLALSIVFFSFKPLSENKFARYFLLILLAGLIHFSAIIFIFGVFLTKKINTSVIVSIFIIGMMIFIFRIRWMVSSIDALLPLFSNNGVYLTLWAYTTSTAIVSEERPIFIMLFINSFLYLFYLWGWEKHTDRGSIKTIFFNLYTLFILATLFLWEISDFGVRFGLYFSLGLIISLPYMLDFFNKSSRAFVAAFIILYCFINIRPYVLEDRSVISYNPYQNYVVHELFDLKSTGAERRDIYIYELGGRE